MIVFVFLFCKCLVIEILKLFVVVVYVNMVVNGIDNVVIARLSAEELCDVFDGGREYMCLKDIDFMMYDLSIVFVDLLCVGMGDEVSKFCVCFDRIIYISCNSEILARDCKIFGETYEIK